jgi:hypothetical protein
VLAAQAVDINQFYAAKAVCAQNAQRSFLMKTKRFFLFGLPAVLLAVSASLTLGLVLAGCGDDDEEDGDGGGGGATLPDYAGTYTGTFNQSKSPLVLTVTADSLSINDSATTTISSVTTSAGGSTDYFSWVYLNAGGAKIGIAVEGTVVNMIYLGTASVAGFIPHNDPIPEPSDITDGAITGSGYTN